jgi:YVTN family beta-propeller protein
MEFRVLGPLEVVRDDRILQLGGGRQLALVAVLLLHANKAVSVDRLVDDLWGESPPPTAAKIVRNSVSLLRRELGDRLVTEPPGYLLRVEEGELDSDRLEQAVASGDLERMTKALTLWRGRPLAQVAYEPFAQDEIARLEELHLTAIEARIDAQLALGQHTQVIAQLDTLVRQHPLREHLCAQLMVSLYRSGRQADALDVYRRARRSLDEELGIEPGPELRELERKVLNQDESLASPKMPPPPGRRLRGPMLVVAGAGLLLAAAAAAATFELTGGGAAGLPAVAGNSIGVVDAKSGRIVAQVPAGTSPSDVAVGAGSVWATSVDDRTATRFDLDGAGIRQAIGVGDGPSDIAADGHGIWVANSLAGTVSRIDPRANRVVQNISVGSTPAGIALAGGDVWVVSEGGQLLTRLDARTGGITARIPVGPGPIAVAVGPGAVWVADQLRGVVFRVDPNRRQVVDTIPVGNGPTSIAVGAGGVWVANNIDGTVSLIDPKRDVVKGTIPVGDGPRGLAILDGHVWVSNEFAGTLVEVDPRTNEIERVVPVGERPQGVATADGKVYVAVRSAGGAHRGGTLRLVAGGRPYKPRSVDTLNLGIAPTTILTNDGLVGFRRTGGSDGSQLVPDLALTLPTPTDGGRTYTFRLRDSIRYSNGRLVRPDDIRRAIERSVVINHDYYLAIVGADACTPKPVRCDLSRGIVTDNGSGTVTFHLRSPDPDFLYELALPGAFAVPATTPLADVGIHPLPATGPYMIGSYKPGGGFTYVRNPRFREWSNAAQPAGSPDRIVISSRRSFREAVRAVERGSQDFDLNSVPSDLVREVKTQYASQTHVNPQQGVTYLFLNTKEPPFDDLRVRRAVNYAVDRFAAARISTRSTGGSPTCQILPPDFPGYERYCPYALHPVASGRWNGSDLARARELVAASATGGARVTVWEPDNHRGEARFVVALLRNLGYRASVRRVPHEIYYDPAKGALNPRLHVQAGLFSWNADYPAASNYLANFFSCDAPNLSQFCRPAIQTQIRRALALQTTDLYRSDQLWSRIDRAVVDQAPVVPLFTLQEIDIVSARVGNYQYQPQWGALLDQLWVR